MVTTTTLTRMGRLGAALCASDGSAEKTSSKSTATNRRASFSICSPKTDSTYSQRTSTRVRIYITAQCLRRISADFCPISCALAQQPVWYAMRAPANSDEARNHTSTAPLPPQNSEAAGYGLRRSALSPLETLAQSVSTIAPTTTPAATIPLVCALSGNGTWLAYLLATVAILLVALCIAHFARYSASPGSLYAYAATILPPWLGAATAWSLLLAYVATGSSVIGGFYHFANLLVRDATGHVVSAVLLALLVTGISMCIAWRDVKISARLMLWVEASSLLVIVAVVALVLARHGMHLDWEQLHLRGMSGSG